MANFCLPNNRVAFIKAGCLDLGNSLGTAIDCVYSALVFRQQVRIHFFFKKKTQNSLLNENSLLICENPLARIHPTLFPASWLVVHLLPGQMLLAALTMPFLARANRQADHGERVIEGDPTFRYVW